MRGIFWATRSLRLVGLRKVGDPNELALRYGNGVHIKHNLMKYANFFKKNIGKSQTVLDIGCGYGAVAFSIAESINMVKVIGVDIDANKIKEAKKKFKRNNLTFINNDAFSIDIVDVDVIILSNVLEHIEDRVGFLMRLKKQFNPVPKPTSRIEIWFLNKAL